MRTVSNMHLPTGQTLVIADNGERFTWRSPNPDQWLIFQETPAGDVLVGTAAYLLRGVGTASRSSAYLVTNLRKGVEHGRADIFGDVLHWIANGDPTGVEIQL